MSRNFSRNGSNIRREVLELYYLANGQNVSKKVHRTGLVMELACALLQLVVFEGH